MGRLNSEQVRDLITNAIPAMKVPAWTPLSFAKVAGVSPSRREDIGKLFADQVKAGKLEKLPGHFRNGTWFCASGNSKSALDWIRQSAKKNAAVASSAAVRVKKGMAKHRVKKAAKKTRTAAAPSSARPFERNPRYSREVLESSILKALENQEMNLAQIVAAVGVTSAAWVHIRNVLRDLLKDGLVDARKVGNGHRYSLASCPASSTQLADRLATLIKIGSGTYDRLSRMNPEEAKDVEAAFRLLKLEGKAQWELVIAYALREHSTATE